ncbi:DUF4351 domain-containing protein [Aerosakkonemataceae cyanobacterium BLCC-F154]|uniref:DUF4351 domain-containing protein n=1 Tax=Floridaenema fluviatile BLCC-F154 TaxID=3153640 RepID=A0ABV4Y7S9_9CYAN
MTKFVYDQFAKQYLEELLSPLGSVKISRDVTAEVREIDVLFVPQNQNEIVIKTLGILGKIAATTAIIEPYRNPVSSDNICSCIGKLFDFNAESNRLSNREEKQLVSGDRPRLWILSPTLSKPILDSFGANLELENFGEGVYFLPPAFRTAIVVIHQLPNTPETLWLRLLGKGNVQKGAIAQFNSLPNATPFKDSVLELLSNLFAILEARQDLDSEDRELIMQLSPLYLERIQDANQQGIEQGIERGIQREAVSFVMRLLSRRFGSIAPNIEEQIRSLPVNQLEDLGEAILDFQSETDLTSWLEEVNS